MQARVVARVVLLLSATGMMAGVMASESYSPPTSDAFLKSIRSYPFVAVAARREKIRTGVPQLSRCMPSTEVRRLIGDPDFGYVAYKSGNNGNVPSKRIWNYVLEKQARVETVPSMQVVVWFDGNGKLQTVTVNGAPDIEASISRRNEECP
jgi:hypothetical protein